MQDAPKFLVDWEPAWKSFAGSTSVVLRPARYLPAAFPSLSTGVPLRATMASMLLHGALVFAWVSLAPFCWMVESHAPELWRFDAKQYEHEIYYLADSLPEIADRGGSSEGQAGQAGGGASFNPTQVIRVARGRARTDMVAEAPHLLLPRTSHPANLLALAAVAPVLPTPDFVLSPHPPAQELISGEISRPVMTVKQSPRRDAALLGNDIAPQLDSKLLAHRQSLNLPAITAAIPQLAPAPITVKQSPRNRAAVLLSDEAPPKLNPKLVAQQGSLKLPATTAALPQLAPAPLTVKQRPWHSAAASAADEIAPQLDSKLFAQQRLSPAAMPTIAPPQLATGSADADNTQVAGTAYGMEHTPAPANAAGATATSENVVGLVLSPSAGDHAGGAPPTAGAVAMSPSGSGRGLGDEGNGHSIARGDASGGGMSGKGPGSGKNSDGFGSEPSTHGGISPVHQPGDGGAGISSGLGAGRGVVVTNSGYYIPSFATPERQITGRPSSRPVGRAPAIVVVATAHSGTAIYPNAFHGHRFYTVFVETKLGQTVMQFADAAPPSAGFEPELTAPAPIRTDLPSHLRVSGLIISCLLNKQGILHNFRVLQAARPEIASQVVALVKDWRFRPALRNDTVVEVETVLGFGVAVNE